MFLAPRALENLRTPVRHAENTAFRPARWPRDAPAASNVSNAAEEFEICEIFAARGRFRRPARRPGAGSGVAGGPPASHASVAVRSPPVPLDCSSIVSSRCASRHPSSRRCAEIASRLAYPAEQLPHFARGVRRGAPKRPRMPLQHAPRGIEHCEPVRETGVRSARPLVTSPTTTAPRRTSAVPRCASRTAPVAEPRPVSSENNCPNGPSDQLVPRLVVSFLGRRVGGRKKPPRLRPRTGRRSNHRLGMT